MIKCKSIRTTNLGYLLDFVQVVKAANDARLAEAKKANGEDVEGVEIATSMVEFQNARISASPNIQALLDRITVRIELVNVNPLELNELKNLGECEIRPVTVRRESLKESYMNLGMKEEDSVELCKKIYNAFKVDKLASSYEFLTQVDERCLCVANMFYDCTCTLHGGLFSLFYPEVMDIFEGIEDFGNFGEAEERLIHDNILRKLATHVYTNVVRELTKQDMNVDAWTYFHTSRLDFTESSFAVNTISFPTLGETISFVGDPSTVNGQVARIKNHITGSTPVYFDIGCRTPLYVYFRLKFESGPHCKIVDHENPLLLASEDSKHYYPIPPEVVSLYTQFENLSEEAANDSQGKIIQRYSYQPLAKLFGYSIIINIPRIEDFTLDSGLYLPPTLERTFHGITSSKFGGEEYFIKDLQDMIIILLEMLSE